VTGQTGQIRAEIVVQDGGSTGRGRVTLMRLTWKRDDPLAVSIVLVAVPDHPALPQGSWVMLRDFLRYGLEEPTGDGDVRLTPAPDGSTMRMELARNGRTVRVSAPTAVVRDFLDQTEKVVPTGEEAGAAELDALIDELLRR